MKSQKNCTLKGLSLYSILKLHIPLITKSLRFSLKRNIVVKKFNVRLQLPENDFI